MRYVPTDAEVRAAAEVLYGYGRHHGWFPKGLPENYADMDPIGVQEFEALVEHVLIAANEAAEGSAS